jgi:hypothetical protein
MRPRIAIAPAAVGAVVLLIGLAMLRFFEYEGRRATSLETF